ncbi:hypothetical protein OIE68_21065 [Nocardia vinacea]|uniref:hypothetical protein n=1 Tax=Nocardia vinacea TaxID=96468 RepID=UPI002E11AEAC|nr:hypothetical protein OIE68_21065 [Nocardia vinacea]
MTTQDDGNRPRFAAAMLQAFRDSGARDATYDPDEFHIRLGNGAVMPLENWFRHSGEMTLPERDRWIVRIVSQLLDSRDSEEWAEVRPLLRPILRKSTYGRSRSPGGLLGRPAFPFIDEMVVADRPETREFVNDSHLAKWGVSAEEVFEAARENLAALIPPLPFLSDNAIVPFIDNNDNYLTSWLLHPGWLASCAEGLGYPPVAFIPDSTSLILITGDPANIGPAFTMIEKQYLEAERPLSPQGYTVDAQGRVVPFDQAVPAARRARALFAMQEYNDQQKWLSDFYEEEMEAIFVASVKVAERDAAWITATVWAEGVTYALPATDFVVFLSGDRQRMFEVPFSTVVELTGIETIPGLNPPRYRADGWPQPSVVAELQAAAVPAIPRRA